MQSWISTRCARSRFRCRVTSRSMPIGSASGSHGASAWPGAAAATVDHAHSTIAAPAAASSMPARRETAATPVPAHTSSAIRPGAGRGNALRARIQMGGGAATAAAFHLGTARAAPGRVLTLDLQFPSQTDAMTQRRFAPSRISSGVTNRAHQHRLRTTCAHQGEAPRGPAPSAIPASVATLPRPHRIVDHRRIDGDQRGTDLHAPISARSAPAPPASRSKSAAGGVLTAATIRDSSRAGIVYQHLEQKLSSCLPAADRCLLFDRILRGRP